MAVPKTKLWKIQPHTLAKHEILRRYLGAWYGILATRFNRVIYIDGFCGPGRYEDGEDGSPIVAIKTAMGHDRGPKEVVFLFTDEDTDRIDHLEGELKVLDAPADRFKVLAEKRTFAEALTELLDSFDEPNAGDLAPAFAFVDPFGWEGLPYGLLMRLLKKTGSEVFVNFMADSVNRFLNHSNAKIKAQMRELFGTDDCFEVVKNSKDRVQELRKLYGSQLQKAAKFVREFEMRDNKNRIQYYLFFATNNSTGHYKMKEAMWRVDQEGKFSFSDHTYREPVLFDDPIHTGRVWALVSERYRGKTVWVDEVYKWVQDETPYLDKHLNQSLADNYKNGPEGQRVKTDPVKIDGSKWTRGFPRGTKVTFPC